MKNPILKNIGIGLCVAIAIVIVAVPVVSLFSPTAGTAIMGFCFAGKLTQTEFDESRDIYSSALVHLNKMSAIRAEIEDRNARGLHAAGSWKTFELKVEYTQMALHYNENLGWYANRLGNRRALPVGAITFLPRAMIGYIGYYPKNLY